MLKRFSLFILTLILLTLSCSPTPCRYPSPSALHQANAATVALVALSLDESSINPYCTGAWISEHHILTALHCVESAATRQMVIERFPPHLRSKAMEFAPRVKNPLGFVAHYISSAESEGIGESPKRTYQATVIATALRHDMALLRAEPTDTPTHTHLTLGNVPRAGDKVWIVGHPSGLIWSAKEGTIAAIRDTFPFDDDDDVVIDGPFIQIDSSIWKGNSGGPVVSHSGHLIGIVSFIARAPNQGFAAAPPSIKSFIEGTLPNAHYIEL